MWDYVYSTGTFHLFWHEDKCLENVQDNEGKAILYWKNHGNAKKGISSYYSLNYYNCKKDAG